MPDQENTERIVKLDKHVLYEINACSITRQTYTTESRNEWLPETISWPPEKLSAIISALATFLEPEDVEKLIINLLSVRIKAKNKSISDERIEEIIGLFKAKEVLK